jgi:hypothetical protein
MNKQPRVQPSSYSILWEPEISPFLFCGLKGRIPGEDLEINQNL